MGINMQSKIIIKSKLVFWILVCLFFPTALLAQTAKEAELHVSNGKVLLEQKKYQQAMAELSPVFNNDQKSKSAPEALYFYSVAALNAKKLKEADTRISQLIQQYPTWTNLDEARFISANIAFEQNDYAEALNTLRAIKSSNMADDVAAMKQNYLARIYNKAQLSSLVEQNPDDKEVAVTYADRLMGGWYDEKDKATLDRIVSRFKLDKKKYKPQEAASKKGEYNVAVLLPFQLDETSEQTLRKNKFAMDLYAGMQLAKDSLAKQNIIVNLYTYDAPADTNKVKAVLGLPELATMDLVIGPVYKSASKIITRFAQQNQIIAINPLSDDGALIKNNPYLYLFNASIATQARKSADFAYDNFPQKTAVVVYSNSPDYITFAQAYKTEFEKRGGKVTTMKPVSPTSSGAGVYSGIDFSTLGHLMVASNNVSVAYTTMSMLERQNKKLPVITYASWLEMSQFSIKQLDEQEIYFLHPHFVDTSSETVKSFKKDYVSRFNIPPFENVYTGFDLIYYFGNILARHGAKFNTSLPSEGAISGVFYQGIGYGAQHDNQYVPLLKLDNLQLTVVNPVFK